MKMKLLYCIILMIFQISASSQEEKNTKANQLDFYLGLENVSIKDKVFSPLVYRGFGTLVEVKYSNWKIKRTHEVSINFNPPNILKSNLNNNSITHINGFISYQYLRQIHQGKYNLNLGGGVNNFVSLRTLNFGIGRLSASEIAFDFYSSLDIVLSIHKKINLKQKLEWKLSYPMAAYVVGRMRVPRDFPDDVFQVLLKNDNASPVKQILKSGELLTINKFVDFKSEITYKNQISSDWSFILLYRFRFYKYPKYLDVNYGSSQFLFGFNYQL